MVRKVLAFVVATGGLMCGALAVAALHDLITGEDPTTGAGVFMAMVVFFGGLAGLSTWGALKLWRSTNAPTRDLEREVLTYAASKQRVTPLETALALNAPLEPVKALLDTLTTRSVLEVLVTPQGELVYSVRGLLTSGEKALAQDPLQS